MRKWYKKGIVVLLLVTVAFCMSACEKAIKETAGGSEKVIVKIAHASSENAVTQTVCEAFAQKAVELLGEEQIQVDIYPNAVLGTEAEMVEALQMGTLDAATFGRHSAIDSRLEVLNLPFLFQDDAHVQKVLRGEEGAAIREMLDAVLLEKKIVALGWYETGFREITSNQKIETMDDLKGLLIRTPSTNTLIQAFQAWGASPTAVDLAELYTALQSKVVDAQENPYQLIDTNKLYEVQDYLCITDHLTIPNQLVFSEKIWNGYPANVQEALREAGRYACDAGGEENNRQNQELAVSMEEKMEITHMDAASLEKMRKTAEEKVWKQFVSEKDETAKIVLKIQELENSHE